MGFGIKFVFYVPEAILIATKKSTSICPRPADPGLGPCTQTSNARNIVSEDRFVDEWDCREAGRSISKDSPDEI